MSAVVPDFVRARPTTFRGVADHLADLVAWGENLQAAHATDEELYEWIRARGEVLEWARHVVTRADPAFESRLQWQPATNRTWRVKQTFDALVAGANAVAMRIRVRADASDLLDQPPREFVLVDDGKPFTEWLRLAGLISAATSTVVAVDPYVSDDTLALFVHVDSAASLCLLSREGQSPSAAGWARFCKERGGTNELRLAPHRQMFHDRFLAIDGRVFLSGASFKDVGNRFSTLIEFTDQDLRAEVVRRIESLWNASASGPA